VLTTIKLDDNLLVKGYEVYDVLFNRLLPSELDSFELTFSQTAPKQTFHISGLISQFYGTTLKGMLWFHGGFPHPLTPSRKGRGDFLEP
jgi:hypothetical protein